MKNKRKRRYLKTSKAVLSAATALLTVSSIASSATSAAQVNEFRIVSDKNYAAAGDRINISVDLLPGDLGTTGFSFDLHFDPKKVSLIVPDKINESDFSVVSSYDAKKGILRVVGAELSGENVTDDTRLNIASFTVLDDAVGEIGYWLDVDADVAFDGNNYINAAFKAPTYNAKYTVIGPEKHDISPRAKIPTQLLNEKYDRYNIDYLSDENDLIDDEYFSNVREDIWDFCFAGYHGLQKWLKDHNGEALSQKDIQHLINVFNIFDYTESDMAKVDEILESYEII